MSGPWTPRILLFSTMLSVELEGCTLLLGLMCVLGINLHPLLVQQAFTKWTISPALLLCIRNLTAEVFLRSIVYLLSACLWKASFAPWDPRKYSPPRVIEKFKWVNKSMFVWRLFYWLWDTSWCFISATETDWAHLWLPLFTVEVYLFSSTFVNLRLAVMPRSLAWVSFTAFCLRTKVTGAIHPIPCGHTKLELLSNLGKKGKPRLVLPFESGRRQMTWIFILSDFFCKVPLHVRCGQPSQGRTPSCQAGRVARW